MNKDEIEIIKSFVNETDVNLRTALEVSWVIQQMVPELIHNLSEQIESDLKYELPAWNVFNELKTAKLSDRYKQLHIWKMVGDYKLRLSIENQKYSFRGFIIGFSYKVDADESIRTWFDSHLSPLLQKAYSTNGWFWYKYLDPQDWNDPRNLINLYLDRNNPGSKYRELIDEFIYLATNAEEAIDKY